MQIKNPKPLKNQDGTFTDQSIHKGVFPQPGDNALMGRGSADVIVKQNEILIRAGKFKGEQLQPNVIPVANQQRGFLQLSKFQSVLQNLEPKVYFELQEDVLLTKYLIEWTLTNPENTQDKFTGSVYLYQLKPDATVNSKNITVDSVVSENLKKLVASETFTLLTKTETIKFINDFIKACNDKDVTKSGTKLFTDNSAANKFPIYYRPNPIMYSKLNPSTSLGSSATPTEVSNISDIYKGIKLNPSLKGGYGLIYAKGKVGVPRTPIKKVVKQQKYSAMTHTLKMTNTSSFDNELLNSFMSNERRRATSFDLILWRIPKFSGTTGQPQYWDEGVGYDYNDFNIAQNSANGGISPLTYVDSRAYSTRPSNWYQTTTLSGWSQNGIYNNKNEGSVNYSGLTIVARQHFELGNEDLNMDMTAEINGILNGSITGVTGWGISYLPQIENITGLTESYSVAFFSRHTQTFYQPYLLTNYNDFVEDDRNLFLKNQENKLFLYVYQNGDFANLDSDPFVRIEDRNGTAAGIQIGSVSKDPEIFGFDFYGILQNEKILNTDIRKVGVTIKKAYTGQVLLLDVSGFYRVYVTEGTTEVLVQDWTPLNRTPNEYYFIFDMRDKIPNQYFVDIQVNTSGEKDTYKRQLTFSIVNTK
jgi:hypothetical protein